MTLLARQSNDAARSIFISSFSFLSAFILRDTLMRIWDNMVDTKDFVFWKVILSQVALFVLVFGSTILAAVFWFNYGTDIL
jgi:hypothetical protein